MDAVNPLNILNSLNLEHGGALNGHCESAVKSKHSEHFDFGRSESAVNSKHSEHSEFGHCESAVNSKHSEHSEFGTLLL